jgi:hypothetical protein
MKEEQIKNRKMLLYILTFHLIIHLILIILYVDSSLDSLLSILGVYNFVFSLAFLIFLGIGGQAIIIGATDFLPGITTELLDTEGTERKRSRVESLKARINDYYFFIIFMFIGIILYIIPRID